MTEDDVMVLGDYAETVLTNPYFNQILNEFDKSTVEVMLATKPEQSEEREKQFQTVWALREFIAFMQQFIKAKNEMIAQAQTLADGDLEDDPLGHELYRTD